MCQLHRDRYGKMKVRILISRVKKSTRETRRPGRGCVDQLFVLKQLVEKGKEVSMMFMDLEKGNGRAWRGLAI